MKTAGADASTTRQQRPKERPVRSVREALRRCRFLFVFAAFFGIAVNLLLLTGPIYMLQIYDRVLRSESVETLVALTALVVVAYAALGFIDNARALIVNKAALRIERLLGERLVEGAWSRPSGAALSRGSDLIRDLDTYRNFIGGPGVIAAMDLPFTPLFVFIIFLLHPWLGWFAAAAILLLTLIAILAQLVTRNRLAEAQTAAVANARRVQQVATASESVRAMGMSAPLARMWRDERDELVSKQAVAHDSGTSFKSATKATRFAVQSLILGLGAYLVLIQEMSPGAMIAASIILGRALAPIEQALGAWRPYNAAKAARKSLDEALAEFGDPPSERGAELPRIEGRVTLENLTYAPPGAMKPIISKISATVTPGAAVGVLGPSGVGKSTLARLLVGAIEPSAGVVRYDGADIRHFDPNRVGADIGYLSQDSGLLPGTIKENIARFTDGRDAEVVTAAKRARAHDMILKLPGGYETPIGEGGMGLSAGQRQRIGLARALFGEPRVVVLDEPNAHLDDVGEAALQDALEELSKKGVTTFVVTHRMSLMESFDTLLVLGADQTAVFGPKQAVIEHLRKRARGGALPPKSSADPQQETNQNQAPADEKGE